MRYIAHVNGTATKGFERAGEAAEWAITTTRKGNLEDLVAKIKSEGTVLVRPLSVDDDGNELSRIVIATV